MTAVEPSRSVAVQALDLAPLQHPREAGEWHYRPPASPVPAVLPAVTGYASPDCYGVTVWVEQKTWTREQLPELIAFLVAVQAAQDDEVAS